MYKDKYKVWFKVVSLMVGLQFLIPLAILASLMKLSVNMQDELLDLMFMGFILSGPLFAGMVIGRDIGTFSFKKYIKEKRSKFTTPFLIVVGLACIIKLITLALSGELAVIATMTEEISDGSFAGLLGLAVLFLVIGIGKISFWTLIPLAIGTYLIKPKTT